MSSSSTTPQPHTSASQLSDVFAGENEDTKRSLCAEVGRLVETELDSLILKLTRKLIANQGLIINSQSSSSSSLSAAPPKYHLNVDELRRLLEEEKEATKVSFRGDLQRCVEPVIGSLFKRLTNKSMHFELAQLDSVNGGDSAPVVNQTESSSNVASLTQPPPTLSSSTSGGSAHFESVPLPPVCNCPNPHPHVKPIVSHREVKQEVKEENEDDAKDMIISGTDINNQLVVAEMKEEQDEEDIVSTGRPSSHVSIETVQYENYIQQKKNGGDEEMCNEGGMSQKEEDEVEDSAREIENGEMMMDIDEEEEEVEEDGNGMVNGTVAGNQGREEEDEDTEIDDNNGEGYDDKKSDEEEDNDEDEPVRQSARNVQPGPSLPATSNANAKVKVLHLNCTESNCNVKLDSLDHLHVHLSTVHQLAPLRCFATNCNARFDNPRQIADHVKLSHSRSTRFDCSVCHKECDSQGKANRHWYQNHQTGQYQCNLVSDCGQVSDTRGKMTNHQNAKHRSQSKHFH